MEVLEWRPLEVDLRVSLEPSGRGTRLRSQFEARPHGFFRLLFPFFPIAMKRQEKQNMANLKARIENRQIEATDLFARHARDDHCAPAAGG